MLWYYDKFDKHKNRPNEDVIFVVSFFCKQIQEKTTSHKVKVQLIELIPERWNNNKNHLDRDVWYVGSLSCLTSSEGSCPSSNIWKLAFFKGFQCFFSGEVRTRSVIQKLTSKSGYSLWWKAFRCFCWAFYLVYQFLNKSTNHLERVLCLSSTLGLVPGIVPPIPVFTAF